MSLKIQIFSLLFSFLYGIIFMILVNLNYKLISKVKSFKILITFLFVFINVFVYFVILRSINNGIVHIYEFMMIIIGYITSCIVGKKVAQHYKK